MLMGLLRAIADFFMLKTVAKTQDDANITHF